MGLVSRKHLLRLWRTQLQLPSCPHKHIHVRYIGLSGGFSVCLNTNHYLLRIIPYIPFVPTICVHTGSKEKTLAKWRLHGANLIVGFSNKDFHGLCYIYLNLLTFMKNEKREMGHQLVCHRVSLHPRPLVGVLSMTKA